MVVVIMKIKLRRRKVKEADDFNRTYLGRTFNVTHLTLLVLSLLSLIIAIVLLVVMLTSTEQKFYFDSSNPITYVFFGLLILFFISVCGLVVIQMLGRDLMPTYSEYKKAKNRIKYLKKKSRFPELLDYDYTHETFTKEISDKGITLESFCDNFRNYCADELHLFYSLDDIRKFVASLGVSKIMILQGMSGTGKTSIAVAFGKYINNSSTVVPVQPMWKEKSDLLGYYNEFTGKFNETTILKKLYEATFSDKINIIILDEMNIARVEYYFSEFLSLLELPATSERMMVVASNGSEGDPKKMDRGKILLPNNVWFLGTANNDDSTFAISDKVYDRAMVMNLNNRAARFKSPQKTTSAHLSSTDFFALVDKAVKDTVISKKALDQIEEFDSYLVSTFGITFGNRIMMQMKKYVPIYIACGGKELEAIDDLIAKKILRKLEAQKPIYVKNKSQELINKLDEVFGEDVMQYSIQYIKTLVNSI